MDPLSLCANIITVLQAAHDVITICYDFRAACKGRPWSLSRVLDQVMDLRSVLERLEKIAAEHDGTSNKSQDAMRLLCASNSSPLVACEQELRALQKLLLPSKVRRKAWNQAICFDRESRLAFEGLRRESLPGEDREVQVDFGSGPFRRSNVSECAVFIVSPLNDKPVN